MADSSTRARDRYTTPAILEYVNLMHTPHDAALAQAFDVPAGIPSAQVHPADGRLLSVLVRLVDARKVVEIGTLVGYSAIHMARALAPGGRLWSIESEPKHAAIARANLATAGLADRVSVVVGAARDVLSTLDKYGPFDAVFVDADKESYDHYGRWALQHVRKGGLVIGENAYLFAELMDDSPGARAMRA
ncbi:MAG: O-methyltransferase, partial [Kofleriaceae bacterium]